MTRTIPGAQPPPQDLTARLFRALYPEFDLHTADGTHIAVPKGTPCFTAPAIGEIARQIAARENHSPPRPAAAYDSGDHRRI